MPPNDVSWMTLFSMMTSLNQVFVPFGGFDLDDDAAGPLRGVPAGLERHPGRIVVGGVAADPVHDAGHVVDEAVADVMWFSTPASRPRMAMPR